MICDYDGYEEATNYLWPLLTFILTIQQLKKRIYLTVSVSIAPRIENRDCSSHSKIGTHKKIYMKQVNQIKNGMEIEAGDRAARKMAECRIIIIKHRPPDPTCVISHLYVYA